MACDKRQNCYKELDALRTRIAELEAENIKLQGRFSEGFKAGREAERSNNRSGCCCQFDENDNIISFCMAHKGSKSERDKYKFALEEIARQKRVYPYAVRGHNCDYKNEVQSKIDIARTALKGEGDDR